MFVCVDGLPACTSTVYLTGWPVRTSLLESEMRGGAGYEQVTRAVGGRMQLAGKYPSHFCAATMARPKAFVPANAWQLGPQLNWSRKGGT